MYSDKKYNFENELLEPKIAKTDQLAKAVSTTELGPFDKASVQLINQDKDVLELVAFIHDAKMEGNGTHKLGIQHPIGNYDNVQRPLWLRVHFFE